MKRLIIILMALVVLVGIYNAPILQGIVSGFFGDVAYQKDNLLNAKKHYTDILDTHSGSVLLKSDTLYNLGNTFYRLGEKEQDTKRMNLWKESIESYVKSLSIRTDEETEQNMAYVQEKLQKEEKEQKQQKKEQEEKAGSGTDQRPEQPGNKTAANKEDAKDRGKWTGSGTQEGTLKKETPERSGSGTNKPQSGQSWSNGGSYSPIGGQNKDNVNSPLSDADQQEVKKYVEELKQFEKQNGKLLNPERGSEPGSLSDQLRNFFGSDSFFQDAIPGNDGKKDW